MKKLLPLAVALVIGAVAAYGMWTLSTAVHAPSEVQIGGKFSLTNQDGKPVTDADYKGKFMLVYFGFTYCPDICPTDLGILAQVMQQLGDAGKNVAPVFITVDPERDTPAQLKSYLSSFNPPITGLTGTRAEIEAVVKTYKVYAQKVPNKDGKDYTMDHSAFMYFMGTDGKYLTHFAHGTSPAIIVAKIREYL